MNFLAKKIMPYWVECLLLINVFVWSSAFVGIRYVVSSFHPGSLALMRCFVGSLCLIPIYLKLPNKARVKRIDLLRVVLAGATGIGLYFLALNYGEMSVSAAVASFSISQAPVVAIVLSIIFLGERPTLIAYIGIAVSIFGVSLITYSQLNHHDSVHLNFGLLLTLFAVLCSGLYVVMQKPLLKRIPPIQFACLATWSATMLLLPFSLQLIHDVYHSTLTVTLVGIYLGIFPSMIGYLLWSFLLSKVSVTRCSTVLYLIPLATILLSWMFLNEVPKSTAITGGLIALFGAFLVNRRS